MKYVFPAIEAVHHAHPRLHLHGRIVREGPTAREHHPAVVLDGSLVESLPTFGALGVGSDIERWEVRCELYSKSFTPESTRKWIEAMIEAFDKERLLDPLCEFPSCRVSNVEGPNNSADPEQFRAAVTLDVMLQITELRPLVRH